MAECVTRTGAGPRTVDDLRRTDDPDEIGIDKMLLQRPEPWNRIEKLDVVVRKDDDVARTSRHAAVISLRKRAGIANRDNLVRFVSEQALVMPLDCAGARGIDAAAYDGDHRTYPYWPGNRS